MLLSGLPGLVRRTLAQPRIAGFEEVRGWLLPEQAVDLYWLARSISRPGAVLVEIGSWKGRSTVCLAKGLRHGQLFAIDPFDGSGEPGSREIYAADQGRDSLHEDFLGVLDRFGVRDRVTVLKGRSEEFVSRFAAIDGLFIDGDHSIEGCARDFNSYGPLVRPGGFVAFHDYDPAREDLGPTNVVHNLIPASGRFESRKAATGLWVGRRRAGKGSGGIY